MCEDPGSPSDMKRNRSAHETGEVRSEETPLPSPTVRSMGNDKTPVLVGKLGATPPRMSIPRTLLERYVHEARVEEQLIWGGSAVSGRTGSSSDADGATYVVPVVDQLRHWPLLLAPHVVLHAERREQP